MEQEYECASGCGCKEGTNYHEGQCIWQRIDDGDLLSNRAGDSERVRRERDCYRKALERIAGMWDGTEMGDTEEFKIARKVLAEEE
jgi:hypothetical protein